MIEKLRQHYSNIISLSDITKALEKSKKTIEWRKDKDKEVSQPDQLALRNLFAIPIVEEIKANIKKLTKTIFFAVPCSTIATRFVTEDLSLRCLPGTVLHYSNKIQYSGFYMKTDLRNDEECSARSSSLVLAKYGFNTGFVNEAGSGISNNSLINNQYSIFEFGKTKELLHSLLHVVIYLNPNSRTHTLPIPSLLITLENRRYSGRRNSVIQVLNEKLQINEERDKQKFEELLKYKKLREKNEKPVVFSFRDIELINEITSNTFPLHDKKDISFEFLLRFMGYLPDDEKH